ncbi:3-dehydroshikimate dehydratase [Marasmius fiardii PR-910]|nr:3-dehydroshikimate dehydratase [Marasmius fiardii PR-910]
MPKYSDTEVPVSYTTCSIGYDKETHTLPLKLKAIANVGFDGIELSMPDILEYGKVLNGKIGSDIKRLCVEHKLKVLMLQPFANFEGWQKGSKERQDAFDRAKGWIRIMEAVGTDLLQVGSTDLVGISTSLEDLVGNLAELVDLCAAKGFRIAYENWCWSSHATSWNEVWKIVKRANRPNLGLCLDTFQSAGGEWGDPTTESGIIECKPRLEELARTLPAEKIYLLQISDAYKMNPPLAAKDDESGLHPRGQWSHDYRPLPYEGGYLPIQEFLNVVMRMRFRGWLSVEVFDPKGQKNYGDMGGYAQKAMDAVRKLLVP